MFIIVENLISQKKRLVTEFANPLSRYFYYLLLVLYFI